MRRKKKEDNSMELYNCNASPIANTKDYDDSSNAGLTTSSVDPDGKVLHLYHLTIISRTGELVVLFLVLIAWLLSVAVFLHRWRHLRILPPRALLFKDTTPKNLHHVKVVACPADSVIYRGYSKGVVSTLHARFQRVRRTFSKRITNLPLAMVTVRHRPSMGRPSFYGRPSSDGRKIYDGCQSNEARQSRYGRPSYVGRHRVSTFYRAPRWTRSNDLASTSMSEVMESIPEVVQSIPEVVQSIPGVVQSIPEVMQSIPEVMQSIPEVMQSIPEVVQSIPEVVQSIPEVMQSTPEVVQSTPEVMKSRPETATSISEVSTLRPEVGHSRPEVIVPVAEVVVEFTDNATFKRELDSSP